MPQPIPHSKPIVFLTDKLYGAQVYGKLFLSDAPEEVRKMVIEHERNVIWPRGHRLQPYVVKDFTAQPNPCREILND